MMLRPTLIYVSNVVGRIISCMLLNFILRGNAQLFVDVDAGHCHKDAGRLDPEKEYRLVESIRLYSEASRVARTYRYDTKDCMQLMKHMTTVASLIAKDILLLPTTAGEEGREPRVWHKKENAVSAATWLVGFFDSLVFWEEQEETSFVEILGIRHKHFLGKLFQLFSLDVRMEAIALIHTSEIRCRKLSIITEEEMIFFQRPQSMRLSADGLLVAALTKEKIVVRDLEMALPSNGSTRQRRRTCIG